MDRLKQSLKILKQTKKCNDNMIADANEKIAFSEAFDDAIDALDRQIPKNPKNIKNVTFNGSIRNHFKSGDCPSCNAYVDTDDDLKFCTECGQRLEW